MTDASYREGRIAGLRLAIAVLAAEELRLAAKLDTGKQSLTRRDQRVRHKAFKIAQTRVGTTLNRLTRNGPSQPDGALLADLERLGL